MQIYRTELAKTSPIPAQLEFLRAAHRRGLLKTKKEQQLYRNLELGAQGEQFVMETLEKYGRKHWITVQNLWLDHYGVYESDILLLTSHRHYLFEVKNYDGLFEYKDSRCFINGKKLKENCVQQAEKAFMNLQEMCGTLDRSIPVEGALLMVGEHNDVRLHSPADGIDVYTRYQLRNYVQLITREEETHYHQVLDPYRTLDHFEKNAVLNPFGPLKSYSPAEILSGRCGISCAACSSYELETTRKFVRCACGHQELRREAIVRTIHEYGVLTFEHDFMKRRELQEFLGGQVSETYLVELLNLHFERVHGGKHSKYQNKKALYYSEA